MKVEIELTEQILEMLERYRKERIVYYTNGVEIASNEGVERYKRSQVESYEKASHEYLAGEYLLYQAFFEHKKTD